ncbi:SET domain containing 2 [Musca autumnalis]|uniref:SET domain containing 2 n=1 Tax=Musca autumnalis TaxID=221902 RepID=UPI003CF13430
MDTTGNQRSKRSTARLSKGSACESVELNSSSSSKETTESPTDVAALAISPTPEGRRNPPAIIPVSECRRSSRKKIIKFDVRDLLNKNRKPHKIQIEARIDSNVPSTSKTNTGINPTTGGGGGEGNNNAGVGSTGGAVGGAAGDLSSKQKTFMEKSAIFRRYSISQEQTKPPPPPIPPMPPAMLSKTVGDKDATSAILKPKQTTSLIVAQMESNVRKSLDGRRKTLAASSSSKVSESRVDDMAASIQLQQQQQKRRGRPPKQNTPEKVVVDSGSDNEPKEVTKKLTPEKATNWKEYKACLALQQDPKEDGKETKVVEEVEKKEGNLPENLPCIESSTKAGMLDKLSPQVVQPTSVTNEEANIKKLHRDLSLTESEKSDQSLSEVTKDKCVNEGEKLSSAKRSQRLQRKNNRLSAAGTTKGDETKTSDDAGEKQSVLEGTEETVKTPSDQKIISETLPPVSQLEVEQKQKEIAKEAEEVDKGDVESLQSPKEVCSKETEEVVLQNETKVLQHSEPPQESVKIPSHCDIKRKSSTGEESSGSENSSRDLPSKDETSEEAKRSKDILKLAPTSNTRSQTKRKSLRKRNDDKKLDESETTEKKEGESADTSEDKTDKNAGNQSNPIAMEDAKEKQLEQSSNIMDPQADDVNEVTITIEEVQEQAAIMESISDESSNAKNETISEETEPKHQVSKRKSLRKQKEASPEQQQAIQEEDNSSIKSKVECPMTVEASPLTEKPIEVPKRKPRKSRFRNLHGPEETEASTEVKITDVTIEIRSTEISSEPVQVIGNKNDDTVESVCDLVEMQEAGERQNEKKDVLGPLDREANTKNATEIPLNEDVKLSGDSQEVCEGVKTHETSLQEKQQTEAKPHEEDNKVLWESKHLEKNEKRKVISPKPNTRKDKKELAAAKGRKNEQAGVVSPTLTEKIAGTLEGGDKVIIATISKATEQVGEPDQTTKATQKASCSEEPLENPIVECVSQQPQQYDIQNVSIETNTLLDILRAVQSNKEAANAGGQNTAISGGQPEKLSDTQTIASEDSKNSLPVGKDSPTEDKSEITKKGLENVSKTRSSKNLSPSIPAEVKKLGKLGSKADENLEADENATTQEAPCSSSLLAEPDNKAVADKPSQMVPESLPDDKVLSDTTKGATNSNSNSPNRSHAASPSSLPKRGRSSCSPTRSETSSPSTLRKINISPTSCSSSSSRSDTSSPLTLNKKITRRYEKRSSSGRRGDEEPAKHKTLEETFAEIAALSSKAVLVQITKSSDDDGTELEKVEEEENEVKENVETLEKETENTSSSPLSWDEVTPTSKKSKSGRSSKLKEPVDETSKAQDQELRQSDTDQIDGDLITTSRKSKSGRSSKLKEPVDDISKQLEQEFRQSSGTPKDQSHGDVMQEKNLNETATSSVSSNDEVTPSRRSARSSKLKEESQEASREQTVAEEISHSTKNLKKAIQEQNLNETTTPPVPGNEEPTVSRRSVRSSAEEISHSTKNLKKAIQEENLNETTTPPVPGNEEPTVSRRSVRSSNAKEPKRHASQVKTAAEEEVSHSDTPEKDMENIKQDTASAFAPENDETTSSRKTKSGRNSKLKEQIGQALKESEISKEEDTTATKSLGDDNLKQNLNESPSPSITSSDETLPPRKAKSGRSTKAREQINDEGTTAEEVQLPSNAGQEENLGQTTTNDEAIPPRKPKSGRTSKVKEQIEVDLQVPQVSEQETHHSNTAAAKGLGDNNQVEEPTTSLPRKSKSSRFAKAKDQTANASAAQAVEKETSLSKSPGEVEQEENSNEATSSMSASDEGKKSRKPKAGRQTKIKERMEVAASNTCDEELSDAYKTTKTLGDITQEEALNETSIPGSDEPKSSNSRRTKPSRFSKAKEEEKEEASPAKIPQPGDKAAKDQEADSAHKAPSDELKERCETPGPIAECSSVEENMAKAPTSTTPTRKAAKQTKSRSTKTISPSPTVVAAEGKKTGKERKSKTDENIGHNLTLEETSGLSTGNEKEVEEGAPTNLETIAGTPEHVGGCPESQAPTATTKLSPCAKQNKKSNKKNKNLDTTEEAASTNQDDNGNGKGNTPKRGRRSKSAAATTTQNQQEIPNPEKKDNEKEEPPIEADNRERKVEEAPTTPSTSSSSPPPAVERSLDEKLAKKKRQKKLKEDFEAALNDKPLESEAHKHEPLTPSTSPTFGFGLAAKQTENTVTVTANQAAAAEEEEDPDPLKDIGKFIEDGLNLLKKGYKLDEDSVDNVITSASPTATADATLGFTETKEKEEESITPSKKEDSISFHTFETPADTPLATPSVTPPPPSSGAHHSENKSPDSAMVSSSPMEDDQNSSGGGVRRSHRLKLTKTPKALVGRGLVRDKERFSIKDDVETKSHYTLDDHLLDLAEVEAKNAKFLKEMEERLSNFQVIKENEYKCERVISREARKMICDCFLTPEEEERGELACGEDCLNRLLMIECGHECNVKDRCTNKRFQKYLCSPCRVFRTEKKGFGIMADIEILPGEFIMEYVGEVIDTEEFERRRILYSQEKNRHYYFMALRSDAIIDATIKGNISRFINHSCDPNAETQKWTVNGELRIGFFSRKSIMPGEEITFDYQYQRYGREAQRCYCESANCRGWIGQEPNSDEGEQIDDDEEEDDSDEEEDEADVSTRSLLEDDEEEDSDASDVYNPEEVQKKLEMAAAQAEAELAPIPLETKSVEEKSLEILANKEESKDPETVATTKTEEEDSKSKFKKLLSKMAEKVAAKNKQHKREQKLQKRKKRSKESSTTEISANKQRSLEDPDIEDEVQFLSRCGLKTQADTLRLSRLMVRAKLMQTRLHLLDILRKGELPCRRLFLDYHGLRLLHGWMSEDAGNMQIRLALLQTLELLPIANKTVLTDSKVMQVVRNWCGSTSGSSTTSANLSPNEDSSSNSQDGPSNAAASTQISDGVAGGGDLANSDDLQKLSQKLITNWESLPEIFRIPKKERIEQMKEHEREADRQYAENEGSNRNDHHRDQYRNDRFGRRFTSSTSRFGGGGGRSHNVKLMQQQNNNGGPGGGGGGGGGGNNGGGGSNMQRPSTLMAPEDPNIKNLSKTQRREMFAAKVARDEAEKRMAEERREFETKCRFFGLDPKKTRPQDVPFCVNPATGQWFSVERKPITTPPSYAYIQVPVKPKSTNPEDYQLPAVCNTLPPEWKFAITPLGQIYYYHVQYRVPQWEPPSASQLQQSQRALDDNDSGNELSSTTANESSEDDDEILIGMNAEQLKAYIDRKVELRRQKRYQRLVDERSISPRREEDRIYNQLEVRKYKENKEKIRKRKEEIRRRRAEALRQSSLNMCTLGSLSSDSTTKTDGEEDSGVLPIQDYLLSSDEDEDIKAEINSPLIDKIVEGDKIVDELDALTTKRPLKRPLPAHRDFSDQWSSSSTSSMSTSAAAALSDRQEYKKRKLEKKDKRKPKEQDAKYRRNKEKFRCEIAGIIVHHLKPYRRDTCTVGQITSNEDFNHLARKLTHFVMIKELKYCESVGQTLVVTESVKNKSREFIKKYMAKYGEVYVKPANDPEFKDIPFTL